MAMRNAVSQFLAHYHLEWPHQSLSNELIESIEHLQDANMKIETTERLGGLLRFFRGELKNFGPMSSFQFFAYAVQLTLA